MNEYSEDPYSYSFTYENYKYNSYEVEANVIYTSKYFNGSNIKDFLEPMVLTINYINNPNIETVGEVMTPFFEKGILYLYNFKSNSLLNEYQNLMFKYSISDDRLSNYVSDVMTINDGDLQVYNY